MSGPSLISRALQRSVGHNWLPDVVYLLYLGGGDPLLCVIYEDNAWAHDQAGLQWLPVPPHRCTELRNLTTTWA